MRIANQWYTHAMRIQTVAILLLGIVTGAVGTQAFLVWQEEQMRTEDMMYMSDHTNEHGEGAYHSHIDFAVYITGKRLDFTKDEYQSTAERILHPNVHLHDNQGDIVHYHAPDITFDEFFDSIGYILTNECFTTSNQEMFCTDETNTLALFVNNEQVSDIPGYIETDLDRVLLYYGDLDDPELAVYLADVSDRACIYSGSCPERGTPPPEECGLTCEI